MLVDSNLFENPNKNNLNIIEKIFKKKKEKESIIEENTNIDKPTFIIKNNFRTMLSLLDKENKINIDIAFEDKNYNEYKEFKLKIVEFEGFRLIYNFLKFSLKKNKLSTKVEGGVYSDMLFNMVFIYFCSILNNDNNELVDILISFFDFYINFEYTKYSIFVSQNLSISYKERLNNDNKRLLSIINFIYPDLDIGKWSYDYHKVLLLWIDVKQKLIQNEVDLNYYINA